MTVVTRRELRRWFNIPPRGIKGGLYPNLSSLAQRSEQQ